MKASEHSRIIRDAAKQILKPLGFRQRGQSRLWFADHGYWLRVIEFQPSSWGKGSYLNVAAHWLWSPRGENPPFVMSFDYGGRVHSFVKFEGEQHFAPLATALVNEAAKESDLLKSKFPSLESVAKILVDEERSSLASGRGGHWQAYYAGVAAGLLGNVAVAREMFESINEKTVPEGSMLHLAARTLHQLVGNVHEFRVGVGELVGQQRAYFKLEPWSFDFSN